MKKALFFTKINFGHPDNQGIYKKVIGQVEALRGAGIETDFAYIKDKSFIIATAAGQKEWVFEGLLSSLRRFTFIFFTFIWKGDWKAYSHLYIRQFLTTPAFIMLLWGIKKRNKTIQIAFEIPTYPYKFGYKKAGLGLKLALYVDLFTTLFYRYVIDKLVLFADKQEVLGIPVINIDNGIDLKEAECLNLQPHPEPDFNLVFLANLQVWHGFDRVITGLHTYLNAHPGKQIKLHIVGNGPEKSTLQQQVKDLGLDSHVVFHGFMKGKELAALLKQCQLAVGSLGMHRIKVANGETSPLKVREYTAMGIPFIYAYQDRILANDFDFGLKLPADESPIDIAQIRAFYDDLIVHHPDFSQKMRLFAETNFGWEKLMQPVFAYLKST